ncbi:MAG: glycoside hydrolase family 172 protein [Planctomycetota bacterium]
MKIVASLLVLPLLPGPGRDAPITTAALLDELADLDRLTRLSDPPYRVRQYSSTDRRSVAPGEEGWFSNADGFGGEPIPGFAAVLRAPGEDGVGLYLVCDVEGPGAIVRGWSAGMDGTMRVTLDGAEQPVFAGTGYDFLARRSRVFLEQAGIALDTADALIQQDADYLPVPFAKRLYVTWEGKLDELHFYHLEVRSWEAGTPVETFAAGEALRALVPALERAAEALVRPGTTPGGREVKIDRLLNPHDVQQVPYVLAGRPGVLTELRLRVEADDLEAALRGVLLAISFDGSRRPAVLAPIGDFFASGVGINPYDSLPLSVAPDGTMTCRWPMPYANRLALALRNGTAQPARVTGAMRCADRDWDDRSMHFHARWRHEPSLPAREPADLTFLRADGAGRLVGVASILLNPSPTPTPWGNWWGEGDEKVFVDGERYPSFLGTGSEDYYNYSWSRPDLFDHPYCGQPLDSGPGNAGHVVNYRWHVIDDVPYRESLLFAMELWPHRAVFPISYARMAYWYALPGGGDDFRDPTPPELEVPRLPTWEPVPILGSADSTFYRLEDVVKPAEGRIDVAPEPLSSRGRLLHWAAKAGDAISFPLSIAAAGDYGINLVARHRPDGATIRVLLDGEALPVDYAGGSSACAPGDVEIALATRYVPRILSLGFPARSLAAGEHAVTLECVKDGDAAFDYLWVKTHRLAAEGGGGRP